MSVIEMSVSADVVGGFDRVSHRLPGKEVSRKQEFPGLWVFQWDNPAAPEGAVSMVPWWLADSYGEAALSGIDYYDSQTRLIKEPRPAPNIPDLEPLAGEPDEFDCS